MQLIIYSIKCAWYHEDVHSISYNTIYMAKKSFVGHGLLCFLIIVMKLLINTL